MSNYAEAHRTVRRAIMAGELLRQDCEECGAASTQAHHDDYDKPLVVRWLCRTHHRLWHAQHGAGANRQLGSRRLAVFILPATDYAALERLAASEERSVSAELRLAVRAYLRAKEGEGQ